MANAVGVNGSVTNSSTGTITNAIGVQGFVSNFGTGTISSAYGIYSGGIDNWGTVNKYYGVYVAAPTNSGTLSNKYALVTESGAGNVGIGTTSPGNILDIQQYANSAYSSTAIPAGARVSIQNTYPSGNQVANLQLLPTSGYSPAWIAATPGSSSYTDLVFGARSGASTYQENMRITATGNVGVGTTAPRASLDVNGTITGKASVVNASATVDFSTGNIQHTTSNCGAFNLWNMKDGGTYVFVVKGTTSGTCALTCYSDGGTTALTVHMPPGHGATTAGKHTLYNALVSGGDVYFTWIPGY